MVNSELNIPMPLGATKPPRAKFLSPFCVKDKVTIDGQKDLVGTVTGHCWKSGEEHTIEVSWIHNGANCVAWFQAWRLKLVEPG